MSEVIRMHNTLQRDYGRQDWSLSFRAGPECICILGKCLLITSRSDIMGVQLQGPGLKYVIPAAFTRSLSWFIHGERC
jgi:hypothetical protein